MGRYVWVVLFFGAVAWVGYFNATHDDRQLMMPFVDLIFPADAADPRALGARSVQALGVIGVIFFVSTVVGHVRSIQRRRAEAEAE